MNSSWRPVASPEYVLVARPKGGDVQAANKGNGRTATTQNFELRGFMVM
jgi:hypothetical protein